MNHVHLQGDLYNLACYRKGGALNVINYVKKKFLYTVIADY